MSNDWWTELEELEKKATPGPWVSARVEANAASGPHEPYAFWTNQGPRVVGVGKSLCVHADDMDLIAALRNAFPAIRELVKSAAPPAISGTGETPRTDAFCLQLERDKRDIWVSLTMIQDLARTLERELSAGAKGLTFDDFRAANVSRCVKWHPQGIASWSPSDWLTAVTGELGELASLLKMRNRERDGLPGNKFSPTDKQVADELADVLTYLDLLAEVLGVNLGRAAAEKFNDISERVGFPDRIPLPASPKGGQP